ncbi:MAG TPA: lysophospholipid acyltransferase family protein, partial [Kiloniellales bacterium]|nr:lysophospholipid acyltransferase family protein [Kiloniellales bacterium]
RALEPLSRFEAAIAWPLYHLNRLILRGLFRLRVSGLDNLSVSGPVIIAPNHASVLDPFVLCAALPYSTLRRTCFTGWTGMAFANPLFRVFARLARALPIEQARAAFSSLALPLAALRRESNVVWFPEGARSPDGTLRTFMPGIGILLETYPVAVVPTSISGTFEAMPTGRRLPRLRPLSVRFGRARLPSDLAEIGHGDKPSQRITDALHGEVESLMREA